MSKFAGVLALALLLLVPTSASAQRIDRVPTPELNPLAVDALARPCAYEGDDPYEKAVLQGRGLEGTGLRALPGRLPAHALLVRPDRRQAGPERRARRARSRSRSRCVDGYITRFKPNLVRADGTVPPVEQVHLHHGTWLSVPDYGSGPFFASGEEKTIAPFPRGYGMPVKAHRPLAAALHGPLGRASSRWRSTSPTTSTSSRRRRATTLGMKPALPALARRAAVGLPGLQRPARASAARTACARGRRSSAPRSTPWGERSVGQGEPGNGKGEDCELPAKGEPFGRVEQLHRRHAHRHGRPPAPGRHPERDRPRPRRARRSGSTRARRATGTERQDEGRRSAGLVGLLDARSSGNPFWGVHVKPGDMLRSNVDLRHDDPVDLREHGHRGQPARARRRERQAAGARGQPVQGDAGRRRSEAAASRAASRRSAPTLCDKGIVDPRPPAPRTATTAAPDGDVGRPAGAGDATRSAIADFLYAPGDLSTRDMTGIPTVKLGETLRFTNPDGAAIYHTITSCKFPCLGPTGRGVPARRRRDEPGRKVDLDSSELGFGAPEIGAAKNKLELVARRHEGGGLQARRGRHVLLPHPPVHARRVRGQPSELNWKRNWEPLAARARARDAWETMSEDLPVDVLPCSNDEYFPPPPTPRAAGDHGARRTREVERWRRKFNMSRREFVRTVGGDGDRLLGDRRRAPGHLRATTAGAQRRPTERPDACDLEWAGPQGARDAARTCRASSSSTSSRTTSIPDGCGA